MAKTPESVHTDYVRDKLKESGCIHPWKIIDEYQGGIPDSMYINTIGKKAPPVWVEYKYIPDFPVRDATVIKPKFNNALQKNWCDRLYDTGQPILVVIFVGKGAKTRCIVFDNKEDWANGRPAKIAREASISRPELVARIAKKARGES